MSNEELLKGLKPVKVVEPGKTQKGGSLPKPETPRPANPPQGHKPKNNNS